MGSPVAGRTKSKVLALRATITPSKGAGASGSPTHASSRFALALGHGKSAWAIATSTSAFASGGRFWRGVPPPPSRWSLFAASRVATLDFQWLVRLAAGLRGRPHLVDLVREPLDLGRPSGRPRPGTWIGSPWPRRPQGRGRLDVGLGHLHHLQASRDPLLIEPDRRLLRREILDELGNEERGEHAALLHLVADVHVPFLDVGRSASGRSKSGDKLSMKLGWPTTRTMFRTCGRISRTVGGFVTLLLVHLVLVAAARHREGGHEPVHGRTAAGETIRNRVPGGEAHQRPPGKGAVQSSSRP